MAHEVETMVSGENIVPWHGLGKVRPGLMTALEVIAEGGLDWTVEKHPIFSSVKIGKDKYAKVRVPGHFATIRATDNKPLGVVGDRYEVIQNAEALDWMDNIVGEGQAVYETAGSLLGGKCVWIAAKIPNGGDNPDKAVKYLVSRTTHNGTSSVDCFFTPIRPVCWNTLSAAFSGKKASMKIRHTKNAKEKMEVAKEVIKGAVAYFDTLEGLFDKMHEKKFTPTQLADLVRKSFGFDKKVEEEVTKRQEKRQEEILHEIFNLSQNGKGTDLPGVKGTAWGAYNAVAEYLDHYAKFNNSKKDEGDTINERKLISTIWGRGADIKVATLNNILDVTKLKVAA